VQNVVFILSWRFPIIGMNPRIGPPLPLDVLLIHSIGAARK